MAKYRVLDFLRDQGIEHRTDGPNCARGNVVIHCPYCGPADKSEHMGIRLTGEVYGCWRDNSHAGVALEYLIAEVLSCGVTEAQRLLSAYGEGLQLGNTPEQGFADIIRQKLQPVKEEIVIENKEFPIPNLKLPADWSRITPTEPLTKFAYNYLKFRGFQDETLRHYPLYATQVGKYAYRVIFPVTENRQLVSWTGRATSGHMGMRYLSLDTLSKEEGGWQIKDFIWGYDYAMARPAGPILVHEGPMDALKSCQWLRGRGDALGLFNSSLADRQLTLLHRLVQARPNRKLVFCLDPDALSHTMKMWQSLRLFTEPEAVYLTGGVDPGALDEAGFTQAFSKFLS